MNIKEMGKRKEDTSLHSNQALEDTVDELCNKPPVSHNMLLIINTMTHVWFSTFSHTVTYSTHFKRLY